MGPFLAAFGRPLAAAGVSSGVATLDALPTILNAGYRKANKKAINSLETRIDNAPLYGLTDARERLLYNYLTEPGVNSLENSMSFQGSSAIPGTGTEFGQRLAQQAAKASAVGQLGQQAQAQVMQADEYEKAKQEAAKAALEQELEQRLAYKTQANKELMSAYLSPIREGLVGFGRAMGFEQDVGEGGESGARQSAVPEGFDDEEIQALIESGVI